VIDRYRRQRDHAALDALDLTSPDGSPEELALARSELSDVRRALVHLTPDQQRVIELRMAGLTTTEIQEVLGKGRSWVGTTQFRALKRLREIMRAPQAEAGGQP
jgi:RNA polymerase sigma factor (sigma-70 family)